MQSWGRSSYCREMIELQADMELKDTIVVAMPKLVGEWFYTCTVHVEYEWKPPRCVCCKVFGHIQDECPKNIGSDVVKNLKKPRQVPRGVLGKPLKKMDYPDDLDSEDEVASVDNELASFLASERVGYDLMAVNEDVVLAKLNNPPNMEEVVTLVCRELIEILDDLSRSQDTSVAPEAENI
ncbi:hypothetical protein Tco_0449177 [Tanacetum coccineum]